MKKTVSIGLFLMTMLSFSQSTLIGSPAPPPPEDTTSKTIHTATNGYFVEQAEIDSMMTAYEAMNLDLSSTEIVVISAVDSTVFSDGLYSLPDSSNHAGPKYTLYASSEKDSKLKSDFMVKFYTFLLATDNDYQLAYDQTVSYFKDKEIALDFEHELIKHE